MSKDKPTNKEAYWFNKVEQWQASGHSQVSFSRDNELELSVFRYWINRHRKAHQPSQPSFLPVQAQSLDKEATEQRSMVLQLPHGMTLTIPL